MRMSNKGRRDRHVIVIAGASGSGKTHLIKKMSQPLTIHSHWTRWSNWAAIRINAWNTPQLKEWSGWWIQPTSKNTKAETLPAPSYRSDEHQSQHQFEDAAADFKANQAARCDQPLHLTKRMAATHLWSPPYWEWTINESSDDCTFSKSQKKTSNPLHYIEYKKCLLEIKEIIVHKAAARSTHLISHSWNR